MTIDQQIQLLQKRGMVIHDKEAARLYLVTNNYCSIINGYGNFFPRNGDAYTAGTTFMELGAGFPAVLPIGA